MTAPRHLVLVGAGHAHLAVLRALAAAPVPGLRLTLVTRGRWTPYSGMVPGLVAGLYAPADVHVDAAPLARAAGAALVLAPAEGLDPGARRLSVAGHPPLDYDLLSLDPGGVLPAVPGSGVHAAAVRPLSGFLPRFEALAAAARAGRLGRLAVVGGGAGGVELMLAAERRLRREAAAGGYDPDRPGFLLVTGGDGPLPGFPDGVRRRVARLCAARGIAVRRGRVAAVAADGLAMADGGREPADGVLWATGVAPQPWLRESGLALDAAGFVAVAATLRSPSHPSVFAAGDAAGFLPRPLPRSGVYAVRAGPVLAANLRRALAGAAPRPWRPQRHALYLLSTGERRAIGARAGLVVEGGWPWRLKDWLDRRFVARFSGL